MFCEQHQFSTPEMRISTISGMKEKKRMKANAKRISVTMRSGEDCATVVL